MPLENPTLYTSSFTQGKQCKYLFMTKRLISGCVVTTVDLMQLEGFLVILSTAFF